MAEVILDGETVNFEGPPPSSSHEVWALIEGHLEQSGLLIDRFLVDGTLWTPDAHHNQESYSTIEVVSMTFEQNVANLAASLVEEGSHLLERWKSGASGSLSKPWIQFQPEGLEILNETQTLAHSIGLLIQYAIQNELTWSDSIGRSGENFNAALSSLMDAFEAGDCISYSDIAATRVCPAMVAIYDLLSDQAVSSPGSKKSE